MRLSTGQVDVLLFVTDLVVPAEAEYALQNNLQMQNNELE